MKTNMKYGVRGEYKLVRRKAVTDEHGERVPGPIVEETPWTHNLLTLTYFNEAFTVGQLRVRGIVVGTGTTAVDESQSALASYLASTTTRMSFQSTINSTSSPRSVLKEWRYRFGEGVAAGNVAEVGMVTTAASSAINAATAIASRARLVDGSGNPTTVTVLSDEFLDVIWRFTVFVPEDIEGSCLISIDGVPTEYNYVIRATGMSANTGINAWWNGEYIGMAPSSISNYGFAPLASAESALRAYTDNSDNGSATTTADWSAEAYTPNAKNRTFRLTWGLTQGNIAIRSIFCLASRNDGNIYMMGRFQILLDKPIEKTNLKTLMLQVNIALDNMP